MTYQSNLKEAIKKKYGTFQAAADALEISKSTLDSFLNGRRYPSMVQLEKFERVFGLKITVTIDAK